MSVNATLTKNTGSERKSFLDQKHTGSYFIHLSVPYQKQGCEAKAPKGSKGRFLRSCNFIVKSLPSSLIEITSMKDRRFLYSYVEESSG